MSLQIVVLDVHLPPSRFGLSQRHLQSQAINLETDGMIQESGQKEIKDKALHCIARKSYFPVKITLSSSAFIQLTLHQYRSYPYHPVV